MKKQLFLLAALAISAIAFAADGNNTCTWNVENATNATPTAINKGSYGAYSEEQTVTLDGVIYLARNIMRNNNNGTIQIAADQVLMFKKTSPVGYFENKSSMQLVSLEVIINSEESFEVSAKADGDEEFAEIELSASDETVQLTSYEGGAVGDVKDYTFRKATVDLSGKNFVKVAAKNSGTPHLYSAVLTYAGSGGEVTHVTSVTLDIHEQTLVAFETLQLTATVEPENADDKSVTWESSDETIASVNENGLVQAWKAGEADITVKSVDGEKTDVCKLTVTAASKSEFALIDPANLKDQDSVIITMTVDSVGVPMLLDGEGATAKPGPKAFAGGVIENTIVPAKDNFVFVANVSKSGIQFVQKVIVGEGEEAVEKEHILYVSGAGSTNDGVRVKEVNPKTEAGWDSIGHIWVVDEETHYLKTSYLTNDGEIVRLLGENAGAFKAYKYSGTISNQIKEESLRLFVKGAKVVAVENVTLDKSEATLKVGEKVQLTATVTPEDATNKAVVWASANEEIATVDETGLVKAVAVGETTITVTTKDGDKTASAAIKVESGAVAVESVALDITEKELLVGEELQLTATISPADATDKDVTWESSKKSVATVDANGLVKAVGEGEAKITVKTVDGGKKASATIKVSKPHVDVTGVTLDKAEAQLEVGQTIQLTATVAPADATNKEVEWKSSNEQVAIVDANGLVKAIAVGDADITVTTKEGGKTATAKITVIEPEPPVIAVASVELDITEKELKVGEELQLTATVKPDDATNKEVEWKSSNEQIATVDANGLVKAIAKGEANITVTTKDGGKTASAKITVVEEEQGIENIVADPEFNGKLMHQGALYIIRDGKMYNATGELVR